MENGGLMTRTAVVSLPFADLRDRLKARTEELDHADDIDLTEALRYLTTLPDAEHTPDSVDALIQLGQKFFLRCAACGGITGGVPCIAAATRWIKSYCCVSAWSRGACSV